MGGAGGDPFCWVSPVLPLAVAKHFEVSCPVPFGWVAVQLFQGLGYPKAAPQCTEMSIGRSSFTGILALTSLKLSLKSNPWRTEMLQALGRAAVTGE